MLARILRLHYKTAEKLRRLRKEAEQDGAYRVAKRIHAVLLNNDGRTSGEIAEILDSSLSRVSQWSCGLRLSFGGLELLYDYPCHRGGVQHHLPSCSRSEASLPFGIFRVAPETPSCQSG